MKFVLVALISAACAWPQAAPEKVTIFEANTAGYKGYRIPALVVTKQGTLLAFCAARKELGDWSDIDIAMRRSTDGGRTWEPMRIVAGRDSMTVDNPVPIVDRNGRVMLNIRSEGTEHRRAIAYSPDGISRWTTPELQADLFEPVCMGSLIRLSAAPRQKNTRILFANPDSRPDSAMFSKRNNMKSRDDLRVRLSYDEGITWPVARLLQEGGTGYSDMAVGPDGTVYILYEHVLPDGSPDKKHDLTLAHFTPEWLTDGEDKFE